MCELIRDKSIILEISTKVYMIEALGEVGFFYFISFSGPNRTSPTVRINFHNIILFTSLH